MGRVVIRTKQLEPFLQRFFFYRDGKTCAISARKEVFPPKAGKLKKKVMENLSLTEKNLLREARQIYTAEGGEFFWRDKEKILRDKKTLF